MNRLECAASASPRSVTAGPSDAPARAARWKDWFRPATYVSIGEPQASRWKDYDGHIRRVFLITELYYGTIRILIEKQFSSELEASMKKVELSASGRSEGSHAVEYEFSHDNVPFAMRIERVRTFNG